LAGAHFWRSSRWSRRWPAPDRVAAASDVARRIHRLVVAAHGPQRSESPGGGCDVEGVAGDAGHVVGTYRMGTDPKTSVVNADQRAHDHSNLFLLGSGVFPTSASSNPTLTIAALALRAVGAITRSING
jgi:glucose dehydrogenase